MNLVELVHIDTKSSDAIAGMCEQIRLCQHPRLVHFIHDNGGKFMGYAFYYLHYVLGIKGITTTTKNTYDTWECWQLCWRHHFYHNHPRQYKTYWILLMTDLLQQFTWWDPMVLKASQNALAFPCDMHKCIALIVEWQTITCNREALLNNTFLKSNEQHINYDYFVGQ